LQIHILMIRIHPILLRSYLGTQCAQIRFEVIGMDAGSHS